jgi:hypothetical protein
MAQSLRTSGFRPDGSARTSLHPQTRISWIAILLACLSVGVVLGAGGMYLARGTGSFGAGLITGEHSHRTLILHSDAYPDRQFAAEVFYTGDVVDETTRSIRLKAAAENTGRVLKPGTFVRVGVSGVLQYPFTRFTASNCSFFIGRVRCR